MQLEMLKKLGKLSTISEEKQKKSAKPQSVIDNKLVTTHRIIVN